MRYPSGRSKRRSFGNTNPRRSTLPHEKRPRLFLDENICRCPEILDVLVRSGLPHLPHNRVFKAGIADEDWMRHVNSLADAVLGKDKRHRYAPREKRLILQFNLRIFTFSSGNLSGRKMADLLRAALPRIERVAINHKPPFVASITQTGVYIRKLH
jgi:hypothetical protein